MGENFEEDISVLKYLSARAKKADMLNRKLIEEHQKTTNTGRLNIIKITEKGKALLSRQEPNQKECG